VATKESLRVVQLAVEYDPKEDLKFKGYDKIETAHQGSINNWVFHKNEKGIIINKDISPERIKLIAEYNLKDIIRGKKYEKYKAHRSRVL